MKYSIFGETFAISTGLSRKRRGLAEDIDDSLFGAAASWNESRLDQIRRALPTKRSTGKQLLQKPLHGRLLKKIRLVWSFREWLPICQEFLRGGLNSIKLQTQVLVPRYYSTTVIFSWRILMFSGESVFASFRNPSIIYFIAFSTKQYHLLAYLDCLPWSVCSYY